MKANLGEALPRARKEGSPISALAVVHLETSTGALNPLRDIAAIARDFDLPIIVDAVGSLGGVPVPVDDWDLDVCVTVPNKCLGAPAGLALASVSPRAWSLASANRARRGWYTNLETWRLCRAENSPSGFPYPTTLPTHLIIALKASLERILRTGVEAFRRDIESAAERVRRGFRDLAFEPFVDEADLSPMLSTYLKPATVDLDHLIRFLLQEQALMVAGGLGRYRGRILRIGNMGQATRAEYSERLFEGIRDFLRLADTGVPLEN